MCIVQGILSVILMSMVIHVLFFWLLMELTDMDIWLLVYKIVKGNGACIPKTVQINILDYMVKSHQWATQSTMIEVRRKRIICMISYMIHQ